MKSELLKRILSTIILLPLVYLIITKGSIIIGFFLIFCLCVVLYEWHIMSKEKKYYYIGIIFFVLSFLYAYKLYKYNNDYEYFLYVLIICISSDIGGFVFGKFFKGPKLTSISPNKTYSGVLGSFIFSTITIFFSIKFSYIFENKAEISNNILLITIFISAVSQVGDITISYFKRLSNLKDTGNFIPGHGGLLDRIDGMLFAFPLSYIFLSLNLFKIY